MQGLVCCKVHARHRSGKSIQGVAGLGFTHLIAVCICDEVGISVGGQRNLARSSRHTCVSHVITQIGLAGEGVGILKGEVRHGGVAQIGHHQVIEQASSVIHHCAAGDRSLVAAVAVGILFHGDIALDQLHVGLDGEGGGIGAALHIEEREGGHFAVFQLVGDLIQLVQLHLLGVPAMGAAQVQSQDAVDVHVHIVVAGELEVQVGSLFVHKLRLAPQGEAAISVLPIRERGILQQAFLLIAQALQGIEAQVVCIAAAVGNCSVRLVEFNILGILLFIAYLVSRFKSILITIRRQDNGLVGIHSHTVEGNFALLPIHIGNGDRRFGVGLIDGVQQIPGQVVGSLDIVIGFSDLKLRRKLRCGFVLNRSFAILRDKGLVNIGVAVIIAVTNIVVVPGLQQTSHIPNSGIGVHRHAIGAQLRLYQARTGPVIIRTIRVELRTCVCIARPLDESPFNLLNAVCCAAYLQIPIGIHVCVHAVPITYTPVDGFSMHQAISIRVGICAARIVRPVKQQTIGAVVDDGDGDLHAAIDRNVVLRVTDHGRSITNRNTGEGDGCPLRNSHGARGRHASEFPVIIVAPFNFGQLPPIIAWLRDFYSDITHTANVPIDIKCLWSRASAIGADSRPAILVSRNFNFCIRTSVTCTRCQSHCIKRDCYTQVHLHPCALSLGTP